MFRYPVRPAFTLFLLLFLASITACEPDSEVPEPAESADEAAVPEADRAFGKANRAMGLYYDVLHGKASVERLKEARDELEEARRLHPDSPRIERDYIQILLALGETDRAAGVSGQLLQQDASHRIAHAMMLDKYQGFEAAKPYYESYIQDLRSRIDTDSIAAEQLGDGITLVIGLLLMEEEAQAYDLVDTLQQQHPNARIWGNYLHLQRREFDKEAYLSDIFPEIQG